MENEDPTGLNLLPDVRRSDSDIVLVSKSTTKSTITNKNNTAMKISILSGAIRKDRKSHKAAEYVAKSLRERGFETDLIDLVKFPLPLYGTEDKSQEAQKNINNISLRLEEADALIFVTPEYHGSFSGALKNALDYFWAEFQKKPVGVVAASSGRMAGINASTQLQHVVLSLGAFPMPQKLLISEIHRAFDDSGNLLREEVEKRSEKFLNEFLWFSEAIVNAKVQGREKAA